MKKVILKILYYDNREKSLNYKIWENKTFQTRLEKTGYSALLITRMMNTLCFIILLYYSFGMFATEEKYPVNYFDVY